MPEPQEQKPSIPPSLLHTMESDVSEYLKTAKPTLLTLLARQAESSTRSEPEAKPRATKRTLVAAVFVGVILAGAVLGYFVVSQRVPPPPATPAAPPPPFITPEATEEISVERPQEFIPSLERAAKTPQPVSTFRRLVIRTKNAGATEPSIEFRQIFEFLGAPIPAFVGALSDAPQFYRYEEATGPRLVVMVEAKNAARALEDLHGAEPSLAHDLAFLFLGSPPPFSLNRFEDRIYHNIEFRYLPLEGAGGRGIGYLHFRAKRLIIIATSEEAIHLAINRLLPNR